MYQCSTVLTVLEFTNTPFPPHLPSSIFFNERTTTKKDASSGKNIILISLFCEIS